MGDPFLSRTPTFINEVIKGVRTLSPLFFGEPNGYQDTKGCF